MKARLIFLLLFSTAEAFASYRVYRLKITHYDAKGKPGRVQHVLSSLDPRQYESYYGAYRWDRVELEDTWYCPGDTSHHAYCPKPKDDGRKPASGNGLWLPVTRQPVIP